MQQHLCRDCGGTNIKVSDGFMAPFTTFIVKVMPCRAAGSVVAAELHKH